MFSNDGSYINGFLERKSGGRFEGEIEIEKINLSPIQGVMFQDEGKNYIWIRRKDMLVYDHEQQQYHPKKREPRLEAYLEKQLDNKESVVAYKGEFYFMRLKFSIIGVWDSVLGIDKSRLNLFVERLSDDKQDIINGIKQMKKDNGGAAY